MISQDTSTSWESRYILAARDAATTRDSFLDWSVRKNLEEERCDW